MLKFDYLFFYPKIVQRFAKLKSRKNEINNVQYVSYDVENSAENFYCIIFNL